MRLHFLSLYENEARLSPNMGAAILCWGCNREPELQFHCIVYLIKTNLSETWNICEMYIFSSVVWSNTQIKLVGVFQLYCRKPPGGDQDNLASFLRVVRKSIFIWILWEEPYGGLLVTFKCKSLCGIKTFILFLTYMQLHIIINVSLVWNKTKRKTILPLNNLSN